MDAFSRFQSILTPSCSACGAAMQVRDVVCSTCGAQCDEAEELLDVVIEDGVPRLAVATEQNNLSRILSSFMQWERGEIDAATAHAAAEPVVETFRDWRDQLGAMDLQAFETEAEREMHGWYFPLAGGMTTLLESYQLAVGQGDGAAARHFVTGLADGFHVLTELLKRYDT